MNDRTRAILSARVPRLQRVYPVPVKPRTRINRWGDWPEDCEPTIKHMVSGWYRTGGVFKCDDCAAYCEPHPYGVPHLGREHPAIVCDDCLIARARAVLADVQRGHELAEEHGW